MASTPKKSSGPSTSGRITPSSARTPASTLRSAAASSNSAQTPPSSSAATVHRSRGSVHAANGTPISARSAVKKPTPNSSAASLLGSEEPGSRADSAQSMMDELRQRLEKAEFAAEEMRRMNDVLQARLDDASKEQAKQEEKMQEDEERMEELENQKRELVKQKRELETIFEAERAQEMKSKEMATAREEEMQAVIQRLKESLSQKEAANKIGDEGSLSRNNSFTTSSSPTLDAAHYAPPSLQRSNSFRNNSKLLLQKDKMIEELRLELAELQIKLMELENRGGGRVQDLEKALIEARVTNARLMEENESFQSLLMERTLNGEFSKASGSNEDRAQSTAGGTSLADELASIAESEQDQDSERLRRLEVEVERQKAENKALTLYINKIIERILKHQGGFETILSNTDEEVASPATPARQRPNKDKDLPPSPPRDADSQEPAGQSFLQRAKSLAYGRGRSAAPRPHSTFVAASPNPNAQPSVVENPTTAPSIPLQRSQSQRHSYIAPRRVQTSAEYNSGAAAVVGSMTRGGADSDVGSPRPGSYFGLMGRMPSGARPPFSSTPTPVDERPKTSDSIDDSDSDQARQAALDALTGGEERDKVSGLDTPSPPRSLGSIKDDKDQKMARELSVLQGNKIRPLRLVTEEQKKNGAGNRNSWMPNVSNLQSWLAGAPASGNNAP